MKFREQYAAGPAGNKKDRPGFLCLFLIKISLCFQKKTGTKEKDVVPRRMADDFVCFYKNCRPILSIHILQITGFKG